MAYIGKEPIVGNFQKCDAITVVNGQAAYTLQVSSTNVIPESANHMLVSLNGILQAPVTSFTVSGATLTFVSNLATGDVIDFVILLGNVLDLGTPSDGTVTNAKLAQDIISGETALASEPADTDEFLVSDAGTLKRIDYSLIKGSGKLLQIVTATDATTRDTTSTSFVTGSNTLTLDITPASTSNKIFLIVDTIGYNSNGDDNSYTIYRGVTNLGGTLGLAYAQFGTVGSVAAQGSVGISYLDSPSSTSSLTYQVYFRAIASGTAELGKGNATSSITAFEIAG